MPLPADPLELLAPSALLSSRWSRDNLVTPEMARLYTGAVERRVGVEELEAHLASLSERHGPLEVETGSLGVLSWNVRCQMREESRLVLLPLATDREGVGGRRKATVPQRCFENAQQLVRRGLRRYVLAPAARFDLRGTGVGASFSLPAGYSALTFGLGSARVDVVEDEGAWVIRLGTEATAEVTIELLAALAYHYDEADGTSITDVLINDGDFLVRRAPDGSFSLRLTVVRRLEKGIGPERFLLYLIQLMAYEDWNIGEDLVGLPVAVSDPMLAFAGFVRGSRLRFLDLGRGAEAGEAAARRLIEAFGRSRYGRAYLPWIRQFLGGRHAPQVQDPRRPWWNLSDLEQRRELLRLRDGDVAAEPLATLIEQLEGAIGVGPERTSGDFRPNDFDRPRVMAWLEQRGLDESAAALGAESWFAGWPYRDVVQLARQVPGLEASRLRGLELDFAASEGDEEGTQGALVRLPGVRPARVLANPEIYGHRPAKPPDEAELVRRLPSFERFMDDVLHDPRFGYYANRVVIGRGGHFSTHPEDLTPHFGRWVASWALAVQRNLIETGALSTDDRFSVVEFGAGNGRLARDFIDEVRARAAKDPAWQTLARSLDYRIYELSDGLRQKQEELLRGDARILSGDARHPGACLERDFPDGVRGMLVTNELPDAFGVHKVVLSRLGEAHAVLVLARLPEELLARLDPELRSACRATDIELRSLLPAEDVREVLLDRAGLCAVLTAFAQLPDGDRDRCLDGLEFDEILVSASHFDALCRVLGTGAAEYAGAIAEEDSGVVLYVNVHAAAYMRELGAALSRGQVLTIDYGDTTRGMVQGARRGKFPLRVYCDEGEYEPRPNHPYTRPGAQDLTADVNFTDLALAGIAAGLEVTYFGPERALAFAELPLVLASTDARPFATFVANPVFKVLALGRGAAFAPSGAGLEALPLFFWTPSPASQISGAAASEQLSTVSPQKEVIERLLQLGRV